VILESNKWEWLQGSKNFWRRIKCIGGCVRMYFAIITTGVLVSSLQDPIGTSVSNHPHKRGQKTRMKPTAPKLKLWSDWSVVHSRPKTPKTAKIRLFDRNLREETLSFHPDQPGGNLFWVTTKFSVEKNSLKQDFFFLVALCYRYWSKLTLYAQFHMKLSSWDFGFYSPCPLNVIA